MATINQPKPSQPGAPVRDRQPLQPGGTTISSPNSVPAERIHSNAPDVLRDELDDAEELARRGNERK
jgi:hypothetical protein